MGPAPCLGGFEERGWAASGSLVLDVRVPPSAGGATDPSGTALQGLPGPTGRLSGGDLSCSPAQEWAGFCKRPGSECFRFCRPYGFCHSYYFPFDFSQPFKNEKTIILCLGAGSGLWATVDALGSCPCPPSCLKCPVTRAVTQPRHEHLPDSGSPSLLPPNMKMHTSAEAPGSSTPPS